MSGDIEIGTVQIPPFLVERMQLEDIAQVGVIERQSFPLAWPERAYRYELTENPKAHFFVVRHDLSASTTAVSSPNWLQRILRRSAPVEAAPALVLGYSGLWLMVDEVHIATIASHPDWRGKGMGELLLLNMLRVAQQLQAINTTLEVRVSNHVAQKLYRKYNFEEVGRRKAYYQDNREDALIMTVTVFQTQAYAERLDELEQQLRKRLGQS